MSIEELKQINNMTLSKVMEQLDKSWCYSDFSIFSQAIDNMKDLEKIEGMGVLHDSQLKKLNAREVVTEFEEEIYKHFKKEGVNFDNMMEIITIMAELMEDLKIINPRMYNITFEKIKNI